MAFCQECGQKLEINANFCPGCGKAIGSQRKQVFEGSIHKCPNCGETVKSFATVCSVCGFEFRDSKVSSAVREFANELEMLEKSRKQPSKLGNIVSALGISSSDKVDIQKENLIRNFNVPNTKEDIFEFMILASSNIEASLFNIFGNNDMSSGERQNKLKITKAWVAKFEQVYHKAKISFGSEPDFVKIENIYENKSREIKRAKVKGPLILFGLMGILVAIPLFIFVPASIKENKLNKTVEEIQIDIKNGNYDDALIKANTLRYSREWSSDKADDWDEQREYLIDLIEKEKAENK